MPLHCLTRRGVSTKHRYDGLSPCSLNREYPSQSDFLPDSLRRKFTQSLKRLIPSYVARDCYILSRLLLSLESPRCFLPAFTRGELSPGEPRLDEKSSAALSKVLPPSRISPWIRSGIREPFSLSPHAVTLLLEFSLVKLLGWQVAADIFSFCPGWKEVVRLVAVSTFAARKLFQIPRQSATV